MEKTALALLWGADNFEEAAAKAEAIAASDILLPGTRPRSNPTTDDLLPGHR